MTYTCNPIMWEAEAGTLKFEASLGYLANSKTAWASCQDPISETQSDKKKKEKIFKDEQGCTNEFNVKTQE